MNRHDAFAAGLVLALLVALVVILAERAAFWSGLI